MERWQRGHPWIYRSDLKNSEGLVGGEVVRVLDHRGWFVGQAFYSKQSKIALRWLTYQDVPVNADFFRARILQAQALRERVYPLEQTYRAIYSEADLLPGLIVDRYDAGVRTLEGLAPVKEVLRGEIPPFVEYSEGALRLRADLREGQKTGSFLDQKANHLRSTTYALGQALDCFAYSGGFALQLATRAAQVTAIEISEHAVALLKANAELNRLQNVEVVLANAFDFLRDAVEDGRQFDTVVLDPPSFARKKGDIEAALRGYKEINLRAMQLLGPGGFLLTCSCSHHVSEALFEQILESAAADAKRRLQIVERRGASVDHPVLLSLPETRYLKCFVLRALQ